MKTWHMTQAIRMQIAMGVVYTSLIGVALAQTNNEIPYWDSFESYTNNQPLTQAQGWSGDPEALKVVSMIYTNAYEGNLPLPGAHAKSAVLDGTITNLVNHDTGTDGTDLWIDMMIHPRAWEEESRPPIPDDALLALYVDTNGYINMYCSYTSLQNRRDTIDSRSAGWLKMTHNPIGTQDWVRLTVVMKYFADEMGFDYFQVQLNSSEPISHLYGCDQPTSSGSDFLTTTNGTWFICAVLGEGLMKSLTFSGAAELDDVAITNGAPSNLIPPKTVVALAETGGAITRAGRSVIGYNAVVPGNNSVYYFEESMGYDINDVRYGALPVSVLPNTIAESNIATYATISAGVVTNLTLTAVQSNMVVFLKMRPESRSLTVANAGVISGTMTPAVGTHTNYAYNLTTNATFNYGSTPLNTSSSRYYCGWSVSSGSGAGASGSSVGEQVVTASFAVAGTNTSDATVLSWNARPQNRLLATTAGAGVYAFGFIPGTDGYVNNSDAWYDTNQAAQVQAYAVGNWVFTNWTGTLDGGSPDTNNPITVAMTQPRTDLSANFAYVPGTNTWTVVAIAPNGDSNVATTNTVADGTLYTNLHPTATTATVNGVEMVCTGWKDGTGRISASGSGTNAGPVLISQDSTITWVWATNGGGGETIGPMGTPGSWHTAQFGTTYPSVAVAETNDYDSDGTPNWVEYVLGLDPKSRKYSFRILGHERVNSSNCVRWYATSTNGTTNAFIITRSTNLVSQSFTNYALGITRVEGTNTWWDTTAPTDIPVYYRIRFN